MSRLPPLEPPFPPSVAEDLGRLMPPGVPPLKLFRTVAYNPRVLGRLRRGGLLDPGAVTLREREIVILRTTARCGSRYEWGVHAAFFAEAAGFTQAELRATAVGAPDDPVWSERERLLIALCDALHERATVPDALWAQIRAELDPSAIIEAVALVGQYHMVSFLTNALGVDDEGYAQAMPTS